MRLTAWGQNLMKRVDQIFGSLVFINFMEIYEKN